MPVLLNSVKVRQTSQNEVKIIAGSTAAERQTYPANTAISVNNKGEMIEAPAEATGYAEFLKFGAVSNIVADYSLGNGPKIFKIQPAANEIYWISILCVHIANNNMVPDQFGGLGGALAVGIDFKVMAANGTVEVLDIFSDLPVVVDADYDIHCAAFNRIGGAGLPSMLGAKVNIRELFNRPLRLDGASAMSLEYTVHDDFVGIDKHYVKAIGYKLNINDL